LCPDVITSHHNPKLKELRKIARRDDTRFVAEGEDLLAAADAAGWPALERYVAGENVEAEALAKVSTLGSGTRAIGVYERRWAEQPTGPLCVALWGLHDPGNVGTVLRSALAFGAASVAIGPDTADPYGPKAVRASMGAVFSVPLARVATIDELPGERVALVAHEGQPLRGRQAVTIVVGAERAGLPAEVVAACDRIAHIPIASESLNAAIAASIALYELTRP
jgi:TrmH family RNA methyltransferase